MSIDVLPTEEAAPLFQVVAGNPTPEELAALAVVVLGLHANGDDDALRPAAHRTWIRRDQLRLDPRPGPGSWRRSARR